MSYEEWDWVSIRVFIKRDARTRLRYIAKRKNKQVRTLLAELVHDTLYEKLKKIEKELKRKKASLVNDPELREMVFKKTGGRCYYGGFPANGIDHVIPRIDERCTNEISNLVPCCASCNATAGGRVFESFEEKKKYMIEQFEWRARCDDFQRDRALGRAA